MELISNLSSGLLGAIVAIIGTNMHHRRHEKRKWKLELLKQLLGNGNNASGEKFVEALNSIFVVFHGSVKVEMALKAYHDNLLGSSTSDLTNQKLLDLFKAMCKDLNIDTKVLSDTYFLKPFNSNKQ